MSQVIKNPSPKARFQESTQNVSKHRDLVQLAEFDRAVHFALLQYQSELCKVQMDNFNAAAACHLKMTGAMEFLQVLRNLSETFSLPTPTRAQDNLDHATTANPYPAKTHAS